MIIDTKRKLAIGAAILLAITPWLANLVNKAVERETGLGIVELYYSQEFRTHIKMAIYLKRHPEFTDHIEALRDAKLRPYAIGALCSFWSDHSDAIPILIETLEDEDPNVRKWVSFTLSMIEPAAGEAIPALLEARQDESTEVVRMAESALRCIHPDTFPAGKENVSALE